MSEALERAEQECLASAAKRAKSLDQSAVRLAVRAHVRHAETPYDQLLTQGLERHEARAAVQGQVHETPADWAPSPAAVGKFTRMAERIAE